MATSSFLLEGAHQRPLMAMNKQVVRLFSNRSYYLAHNARFVVQEADAVTKPIGSTAHISIEQ